MKRLLNRFKQVLLMFGLVFACQSNSMAASTWPTEIVLTNELANAPTGTIVASVAVHEQFSGFAVDLGGLIKYFAMVGVNQSLSYSGNAPSKGVLILKDTNGNNTGLGIAFEGLITVTRNSGQEELGSFLKTFFGDTPNDIHKDVVSRVSSLSFPLLTGIVVEKWLFSQVMVTVSGRLLLIKLGTINSTSIAWPNVQLLITTRINGTEYTYHDLLVTGDYATIISPRTCKVDLPPALNINFGTISSNATSGVVNNVQTSIGVNCRGRGSSDKPTPVYLQIIPTMTVNDDPRAIGLKREEDNEPSNSLVVKANLGQSGKTCSNNGETWLEMSKKLQIDDSITADLEEATRSYSIFWGLCKLKNQSLLTGTYTGSATLSITFN